jgi:hypothetical protein
MGAIPMGDPGCPEFACWTASMASVRMVLMQSWSRVLVLIMASQSALIFAHYYGEFSVRAPVSRDGIGDF